MASRNEKLKKLILHGLVMAAGIGCVALGGLNALRESVAGQILTAVGAVLMFGSYFTGYYWFRKVKEAEAAEKAKAEGRTIEEKGYKSLFRKK